MGGASWSRYDNKDRRLSTIQLDLNCPCSSLFQMKNKLKILSIEFIYNFKMGILLSLTPLFDKLIYDSFLSSFESIKLFICKLNESKLKFEIM